MLSYLKTYLNTTSNHSHQACPLTGTVAASGSPERSSCLSRFRHAPQPFSRCHFRPHSYLDLGSHVLPTLPLLLLERIEPELFHSAHSKDGSQRCDISEQVSRQFHGAPGISWTVQTQDRSIIVSSGGC